MNLLYLTIPLGGWILFSTVAVVLFLHGRELWMKNRDDDDEGDYTL